MASPLTFSAHCREQMTRRRIPEKAVRAAIRRGRPHTQADGCRVFHLMGGLPPKFAAWHGLYVVVSPMGIVVTAYVRDPSSRGVYLDLRRREVG